MEECFVPAANFLLWRAGRFFNSELSSDLFRLSSDASVSLSASDVLDDPLISEFSMLLDVSLGFFFFGVTMKTSAWLTALLSNGPVSNNFRISLASLQTTFLQTPDSISESLMMLQLSDSHLQ